MPAMSDTELEKLVGQAGGTLTVLASTALPELLPGIIGKGLRRPGFSAGVPWATKNIPLQRLPTRRSVLIAFLSAPAAVAFVNRSGDALKEYIKERGQQEITIQAGTVSVKLRGPHSIEEAKAVLQAAIEVQASSSQSSALPGEKKRK